MAVTVNPGTVLACRRGVHTDDFVRRIEVAGFRHHVATFGVKDAGDILFRFFMRARWSSNGQFRKRKSVWILDVRAERNHKDAADGAFWKAVPPMAGVQKVYFLRAHI